MLAPLASSPPQPHENRPSDDESFLIELPAPLRAAAVESIIGSAAIRSSLAGARSAEASTAASPYNSLARSRHACPARAGANEEATMWLMAKLEPQTLHALHTLFIVAEPARAVYFLVRGTLSVGPTVAHTSDFCEFGVLRCSARARAS